MGGAALASDLHVAGYPSPSHHCCPIVIVQSPLSYRHPRNAAVVVINIVSIGSGGGIITIAITIAIIAAVSAIAIVAVTVNIALMTLLRHRCIVMHFGGQSEELDQTTPPQRWVAQHLQAFCMLLPPIAITSLLSHRCC
jgi:hypothetical protein